MCYCKMSAVNLASGSVLSSRLLFILYSSITARKAKAVLLSVEFFSVNTITHEPLHSAWWNRHVPAGNFYKPVEFQGQRSRSHRFFCLHDTCRQYLALSDGFGCYCLYTFHCCVVCGAVAWHQWATWQEFSHFVRNDAQVGFSSVSAAFHRIRWIFIDPICSV